ncbi:MAG: Gfo/Idh/MocA family oxidoreductase [Anaerolineae bacterium]|nr:Gfo/Idh/MocA family oxidoreductase [Anaerolineae bacterium]
MREVRVGMVGAGLVSGSHAQGYLEHSDAEIVAVCDLNREIAEWKAGMWGARKVYTDYDEMLRDPEINAVDIMTPPYHHHAMVIKATDAGKHVNCEKPFCSSVREGKEMTRSAEKNGVILAVDESYVFTSSHMRARELIEEGAIGEPMQIRQRHGNWNQREGEPVARRRLVEKRREGKSWRVDPVMSGGGAYPWVFDHAVHLFALARYFMLDTDIELVYALASAYQGGGAGEVYATGDHQDVPIITWQFQGGQKQGVWMRAERLTHTYDYRVGFSTIVLGSEGMIEVLGEGGGNLYHDGRPVHLILYRAGGEIESMRFEEGGDRVWDSEISYYDRAHANQVAHFLDCVIGGKAPRYGGQDGTREVQVTLAAIRSAMEARPVRVSEIGEGFTAFYPDGLGG